MANNSILNISDTQILAVCCKVEEACADIYRYFSKIYADNSQASALWAKTAKEEDSHAEHFRLAYRLQGKGIQSLKTDMNRVSNLLAKILSIYKVVHASPPTLKEALQFSIKMEQSLAEYHMDAIATFEDENLARLFSSMMNCDNGHITMLESAYSELCG